MGNPIVVMERQVKPTVVAPTIKPPVAIVAAAVQGPPGVGAKISDDAGNQLEAGTDDGLFVPEPEGADFLALYILARG